MKIGIVYFSTTGNTQALAERCSLAASNKELDVYLSDTDGLDRDEFFSSDILGFGSPAQGSEELGEGILELMESITDELKDKKVFLFGSYGWGDGEYMEEFKAMMEEKGAILISDPIICLETPDDEALLAMDNFVNTL